MTKRKSDKGKPGKTKAKADKPATTKPVQARARARGPDPEVWATFCQRVSEGKVERIAAMGLGVPYTTIRSWMDHHPEMRDQLLDARAVEIQRRLDRMDEIAFAIGGEGPGGGAEKTEDQAASGLHPKTAELMMKHDRWRLEGLDPEAFLPAKRIEQTGKDGGPIQTEAKQLVTYEFPKNPIVGGDD